MLKSEQRTKPRVNEVLPALLGHEGALRPRVRQHRTSTDPVAGVGDVVRAFRGTCRVIAASHGELSDVLDTVPPSGTVQILVLLNQDANGEARNRALLKLFHYYYLFAVNNRNLFFICRLIIHSLLKFIYYLHTGYSQLCLNTLHF